MGRRDYGHREHKKPKKDAQKTTGTDILPSPINVEVVKKKKERSAEE